MINTIKTLTEAETSIWALELASKLPTTVQIDGFDVSDLQYPAPGFRPSNVKLYVQEGFKDYPAEFLEQDDIDARFWLCILRNADARPLLKKLLSLVSMLPFVPPQSRVTCFTALCTEPGGYLQWLEPLALSANVIVPSEGTPEKTQSEKFVKIWHKPKPDCEFG